MLKHLQPLPISEEMLGAYLEGNLTAEETSYVESVVEKDYSLRSLVDELADSTCDMSEITYWGTESLVDEDIAAFQLPDINMLMITGDKSMDDIMNSEYNVPFGKLTPGDIKQRYPDTCAIKSQQIILESHDLNISEDELVKESIDKGLYMPGQGGTTMMDVGVLLEDHGMTVKRFINASVDDIALELAQGHHVIVGVDSGELWKPGRWENFEDFLNSGGADHALIVSGIQVNPLTSEREVVLTDPGTGEVAQVYTVEQFEDAWNDSSNFMVIAE